MAELDLTKINTKYLTISIKDNIGIESLKQEIIIVLIGMVIGYFIFPPAIIICCLISIVGVWFIPKLINVI